jgi:hypothetical protein
MVVPEIAVTAKAAQLTSACQSGICKGDAVACLLPDEAHLDQGVKGRALALVDSIASTGQSDAAQQFGLCFVPARVKTHKRRAAHDTSALWT